MNALTTNDRWKMFCMKVLLGAKRLCCRSKSTILKGVAYTINLEIRDLDKRYYKERLTGICKANNIMRSASGSGTGGGQQLFYHTFCMLTRDGVFERIRAADFPSEWYYLLKGPEQRCQGRKMESELWHIQGSHYGESKDQYLVNTVSARGEQVSIFVQMSKLDTLVGGRPLESGDFVRVSADPVGPLRYEVADTIGLDEYSPAMAEWLEDPDTAAALKQYLGMSEPAQ